MSECSHPSDKQVQTSEGMFCMACGHLNETNKKAVQATAPFQPNVAVIKKDSGGTKTAEPSKPSPAIKPHNSVRIQVADINKKVDDQLII